MTAGALWRWLRAYQYEVVVAQARDGRRVAWVAQALDRAPLSEHLRILVHMRRHDLAAVADEHDHKRCGTERLAVIAWSRTILHGLEVPR